MSPRLPKIIFAIVVLAAAGGFFVMFGPPKLMAKTEIAGLLRFLPCHGVPV